MRSILILAVTALLLPAVARAQHHHHAMPPSDSLAWRMPPMDMSMPMMPGIEGAVPVVEPFLPGFGAHAAMIPLARPSEIVDMADGDTLALEAGLVRRRIAGREFVMLGYNAQYPGPLIRSDRGATIVVDFTNNVELPSTVHWHGVRLDNRFDGVPGLTQDTVRTGESFTYEVHFRDAGLYWYHPHVREDVQQDLGLYGNLLVDAPEPDYYNPVNREAPLVLDDLLVDDVGILPYGDRASVHTLMGRFGNVMLVNGASSHSLSVRRGDVVRFYMTNVANARTFNVVFGGARVKLIGSDVSKFEREAWVESVPIAPAERYIVEALFDEPGDVAITNSIQAINHFRGEFYPHVDTLAMVRVSEDPVDDDFSGRFTSLRSHDDVSADLEAYRAYFDKPVDRRLELTLRTRNLPLPIVLAMEADTFFVPPIEWNDAMPMMNWLSSGEQVTWVLRDPDTGKENMDIEWHFERGDVAKLRIFNNPRSFHPMQHPIHLHGQRFLVLSMDGIPNPNLVWKDTATVPVGSTVDLLADLSNPGKWMLHCHIAEHLEAGMMMTVVVE